MMEGSYGKAGAMQGEDTGTLLRQIDSYVERLFAPQDEALVAALEESRRAALPEIQVSPAQGRLLQLLARMAGARRILEIGTLGGYSTIHLARALSEDGTLVSLEVSKRHAEVARRNIERAGLAAKVEVRTGDAHKLLARMVEDGEGPFDVIFIDADKAGYPEYLERAISLSRPGTIILADNTIRGGTVIDPKDDLSRAVHRFNESFARDPRLDAIVLPIIRERIDGLSIALVNGG
jgi:caffeoyl-CoA O-methyltransferase